jgi:catechol 2,3-dioxygenase-like lactoylglutathione lyase family enzyme
VIPSSDARTLLNMSIDVHIRSLQHIGIPVTDLARSTAFYERFGFTVAMPSTFPHEAGTGHVAMLKLGEIILELYEFPAPALGEIRARGNGHIDHIAFDVADVDATFRALKEAGHEVLEPEPVTLPFWKAGCRYCYILGPDGERLEFNQIFNS